MSATGVYDPAEITENRAAGYIRLGGKALQQSLSSMTRLSSRAWAACSPRRATS